MRPFLLTIICGGRSVATATAERIKGCVAARDDTVFVDEHKIFIVTGNPGEFITNFYMDGFEEDITCVVS